MKLIFATNNQHKVEEIKKVLPSSVSIITLQDAGIDINILEPFDTLEANAAEKARVIYTITHINCFSEDTGLEVASLNGEPGVRSARYSGEDKQFEKNIAKLLTNLHPYQDRTAQFRTVICLRLDDEEHFFEGTCSGKITMEPKGTGGFGYDAVFVPDGAAKTFAEMSMEEKNQYSHRRKATDKLVAFLNDLVINQ